MNTSDSSLHTTILSACWQHSKIINDLFDPWENIHISWHMDTRMFTYRDTWRRARSHIATREDLARTGSLCFRARAGSQSGGGKWRSKSEGQRRQRLQFWLRGESLHLTLFRPKCGAWTRRPPKSQRAQQAHHVILTRSANRGCIENEDTAYQEPKCSSQGQLRAKEHPVA